MVPETATVPATAAFAASFSVKVAPVTVEASRVSLNVAVTVALVAPIFLFDLSNYPVTPGPLAGLWALSPIAWAVGVLLGFAALIRYARHPAGWFAASFAVVMAIPRLLYVDMTFLLVTGRDFIGQDESRQPSRY